MVFDWYTSTIFVFVEDDAYSSIGHKTRPRCSEATPGFGTDARALKIRSVRNSWRFFLVEPDQDFRTLLIFASTIRVRLLRYDLMYSCPDLAFPGYCRVRVKGLWMALGR